MYLLYLDDSGSAENRAESYLVLGGLAVFERQVHWLTRRLGNLVETLLPDLGSDDIELHASDIFSGRETPWNRIRDKRDRVQILRDVLATLASAHESVKAFAVAVHKDSYPGRDPLEMAFEDVCSRFDLYLKRIYAQNPDRRHNGLIILDKGSHETSLQNLARRYRALGTRWGILTHCPRFRYLSIPVPAALYSSQTTSHMRSFAGITPEMPPT